MLHRKSELARLQRELTRTRREQSSTHNQLLNTAESLISSIHEDLVTDRSDVVPRVDATLAELTSNMATLPRHHRVEYLLAARCLDGDILRFSSNAALCDHVHTLQFQTSPLFNHRRPEDVYREQLSYRRDAINEDVQLVSIPVETTDIAEMVRLPRFLAELGRAATLLQLAESGVISIQDVDRLASR